jgi:hypothetical protein
MKKDRMTVQAPYLRPPERRDHAVAMAAELTRPEIDIAAVRRELAVPWPRPEVADKTFLRAQKAITVLLDENARLREALRDYAKSEIYGARAREILAAVGEEAP